MKVIFLIKLIWNGDNRLIIQRLLDGLRKAGFLTEEEFAEKKRELLSKI